MDWNSFLRWLFARCIHQLWNPAAIFSSIFIRKLITLAKLKVKKFWSGLVPRWMTPREQKLFVFSRRINSACVNICSLCRSSETFSLFAHGGFDRVDTTWSTLLHFLHFFITLWKKCSCINGLHWSPRWFLHYMLVARPYDNTFIYY